MRRRQFLAALGAGLAACAGGNPRPNVLFVSADDMNDWTTGLGGYSGTVHTPFQDRLAQRGVLFSNAHCAAPVCNPSRTSVLLGLRPTTTGIYGNQQWWRPALPDAVSLPAHFRANGYRAAGAGKVFHHTAGFNPPGEWDDFFRMVFDDPWDKTVRRNYPWVEPTEPPAFHPFNGLQPFSHEFDWGTVVKPEEAYGDVRAVNWAIDYLRREPEPARPFFLAVGTFRPHIPMYVPKRFFDMYPLDEIRLPEVPDDDLDDIPPEGQALARARRGDLEKTIAAGKWKEMVRAYLASITFADAQLGRLLSALERRPDADNTIIVFWSDHGWHLGEKKHVHKSTLWEEATRVPLIIAGPGAVAGAECRRPVSLVDLYPTLIDLCGLEARPELDGHSMKPLLEDPKAEWKWPAITTAGRGRHAVRTERWRYIRYSDGAEELYDHQSDPNEWNNLAGEPGLASVKGDLARHLPASEATPAAGKDAYDFDFERFQWKLK